MDKRGTLVCILIVAAAGLAGCAAVKKQQHQDMDLVQISRWLPGKYDNTAQAKADEQKGARPPHDAVELDIVPIDSAAVARNSFYVQETAADDPRRVFSQQVIVFASGKKGIVESVANLVEPIRWRDGVQEPDIFDGMTARDLKPVTGCDLLWKKEENPAGQAANKPAKKLSKAEAKEAAKKEAERARYSGASDPKRCQMTSHAVMGLVQVELRGELSANEIALGELQYNNDDKLVYGDKDEPFYRFRRAAQ
jgi:CpeT/CpcT family (DUF1001)